MKTIQLTQNQVEGFFTSMSIKHNKRKRGLTTRQALFCDEFIKDSNATAACRRMGIKPTSAHAMGTQFLKRPQVIAELAELHDMRDSLYDLGLPP